MWHPRVHTQTCLKSHILVKMHQNWNTPFNVLWHILHWVVTEIFLFFSPLSSSFFLLYLSFPFLVPSPPLSSPPRSGCEGPVLDLIRRATNQVGIFFSCFWFLLFFFSFFLKIPQNKTKKRKSRPAEEKLQLMSSPPTNPPKSFLKALGRGGGASGL